MKSKPNKVVLAGVAAIHLAVTTLTWRDLQRRPTNQVRGNKAFWRLASGANTAGSAVYWLVGRRR